jgi:hypothetical protein
MRQLRLIGAVTTALALGLAVGITGCKKKVEGTMLSFVPADTPYVVANIEPLSKSYTDGVAAKFAPLAGMYEQMIDDGLAALASAPDDTSKRVGVALLTELKGKISLAGMESLGFTPQAHSAIYGIGLAPVMRIELKDPDAFKAFLARVEKRADTQIPTAKIADQTFWRFGKTGSPLVGLAILQGNQLVISMIPADASVGLVKQLFGITPPAKSMADAGTLEALNKQFGFTPNGSGYLDMQRFMQALLDAKAGVEKEYVAALGGKGEAATPECRAELLGIAANFPRMVVGYTKLDPNAMEMRFLVEAKPELAKAMSSLVAPVPGLGTSSDAMIDFGASANLGKLIDFANAQANAVAAAPYKCAELAELNQSFAKLKQSMSNPQAYMVAGMLKGFRVALSRYEAAPGGMPQVAGKVLIASDNPQGLVSLAQTTLPQLSAMKLAANAAPVALPAGLAPPGVPAAYVAYTDKALGVSIGEGEQAALPAFLAAAPADPAPAFVVSYGGKFFELLATNMAATAAMAPEDQRAKLDRQMALMRDVYGKVLKRTEMSLLFTDRGIELKQTMLLN